MNSLILCSHCGFNIGVFYKSLDKLIEKNNTDLIIEMGAEPDKAKYKSFDNTQESNIGKYLDELNITKQCCRLAIMGRNNS